MHLVTVSSIGKDPESIHAINCKSYQQEGLVTFGSWQYAGFFQGLQGYKEICLARRNLVASGPWEVFSFDDYKQTKDDGHNVISIGISGDGRIHIVFDAHNDPLHYKVSKEAATLDPENVPWTQDLFEATVSRLPGADRGSYFPVTSLRQRTLS